MKTFKIWFVGSKVTEECQIVVQANEEDLKKAYEEDAILITDGFKINFKYVIKVENEGS